MDDAFDTLLATTIFLVATLCCVQTAAIQHQPAPTLYGYEQQLAQQATRALAMDPALPAKINNTALRVSYTQNATLVDLGDTQARLMPPTQLTGQLVLCVLEQNGQRCAQATVGADPRYLSCYTDYALSAAALIRVTVCLG